MDAQFYYCGRPGNLTTSWTVSNPCRRFIGCQLYGKDGACGYFMWVDPPMCARSRVVIPGLLRSLRRLEAEVKREKKMKMFMVMALIST
ncbi:hypothetical protein Vadar_027176 [Vaccinium darrowii]|uniref:Uncharacterized protein n=1 Tax=Vaccinium darrowii TaxID=229202 RepID=A0ACB7XLJ2_9ERIC|nr:hypothetical protein Vadar_027176 [Vaccinium darrowii]